MLIKILLHNNSKMYKKLKNNNYKTSLKFQEQASRIKKLNNNKLKMFFSKVSIQIKKVVILKIQQINFLSQKIRDLQHNYNSNLNNNNNKIKYKNLHSNDRNHLFLYI